MVLNRTPERAGAIENNMDVLEDYKLLLRLAPVPMMLVGPGGYIRLANRHMAGVFEYERDALEGQTVESLLPPNLRADHPELRHAFSQSPRSRRMGKGRDLEGYTRSGKLVPLELALEPIQIDGQSWVIVTATDISDRKRQEAIATRTFEAAGSAMIMVDADGHILTVNEATCRQFGYAKEDLVGQSIEMLIPVDKRLTHSRHRNQYFVTGGPREMGQGQPLHGLHKNGHEFQVEAALTPIEIDGQKMVLATIVDLSERLIAERAMAAQRAAESQAEELRQVNESLTRFAYAASHDLKAPFVSITGMLDLCIEDVQNGDTDMATENMQRLVDLSRRNAKKIEGLLRLAKEGSSLDNSEPVDIGKTVNSLWQEISLLDPDRVQLGVSSSGKPIFITDKQAITSILENLLTNAWRYHDDSKEKPWVHVDINGDREWQNIVVSDNGIGIPKGEAKNVFTMFTKLSQRSGDGIGLSIVHRRVRELGGEIDCSSQIGQGTRFNIRLPVPRLDS